MIGYRCPNKKCNEELHFEQIQGIRLCREVDNKKIYEAYCPACDEYMQMDEMNRRTDGKF